MKTITVIKVLLVATILVSCAPASTPDPITETVVPFSTFTPVPLASETITPTPIPTINVGGQIIPDPHFSNPELFDLDNPNSPIPQFVHALNLAGVDASAERISESLFYKAVEANNGNMAVLLISTDLPETPYNEGDIPILIYIKEQETNIYSWGIAYLKDVASLHNILVGNNIPNFQVRSSELFFNNFNMATVTWSSVDVPIDIMDRDCEFGLSEIEGRGMQEIMWFHLGDIPLQDQTFDTKEEAVAFANAEIDKIIQKYGNRMTIVNIFNEVSGNNNDIAYQLWKRFGDDFFIEVYRHVRDQLPNAKIIYNENYNWSRNYEGTNYYYSLEVVNLLRENNLIDAVGMEMHMAQNIWGIGNILDINETASIMQEFELPVFVTELDVNQTPMSGTEQEKLVQQAQIYEDVVRACVRSEVCEMINFWGMLDQDSWYEFAGGEMNAEACIFDDDGTPKLAYYGVLRGLTEGYIIPMP